MRIALIILHADPARGGAERYTVDLAAALRERGHEATLIASRFPSAFPENAVYLPAGRGTRLRRYTRFLAQLDQHLAEAHYDIVHAMLPVRRCDVYHPHAGIAAETIKSGHLKHLGALPRLLSRLANRLNARRQHFARVERELLLGANAPVVLCLSDYVKQSVLRHYPLPAANMATLFNAVDLARFDPSARPQARQEIRQRHNIPPQQVVGLMVAQDFARKGLAQAIFALAQLNDPRLTLLVVGKQDPAPYRHLAQLSKIADRVIFTGKTTDPYAYYASADFFLLPTFHDPCSLVVLEALAMGLPVISTIFNGACEIMTSGRHGIIVNDPRDSEELASALKQLMDDQARSAMAAECRLLRPRLAYDRHIDELMRIYDSRLHPSTTLSPTDG